MASAPADQVHDIVKEKLESIEKLTAELAAQKTQYFLAIDKIKQDEHWLAEQSKIQEEMDRLRELLDEQRRKNSVLQQKREDKICDALLEYNVQRDPLLARKEALELDIKKLWSSLAPIRKLPHELLAEVFLHFVADGGNPNVLAKVCLLWLRVSQLGQLWRTIRVTSRMPMAEMDDEPPGDVQICSSLVDLRRSLSRTRNSSLWLEIDIQPPLPAPPLDLDDDDDDGILSRFMVMFRGARSGFREGVDSVDAFKMLLTKGCFGRWERVELRCCPKLTSEEVSENLHGQAMMLKELVVSSHLRHADFASQVLLRAPTLETLKVFGTLRKENDDEDWVVEIPSLLTLQELIVQRASLKLQEVIGRMQNLRRLTVNLFEPGTPSVPLPNLEFLELHHMNGAQLARFEVPNLKHLVLVDVSVYDAPVAQSINFPKLDTLDISGFRQKDLDMLVIPELKHLQLSDVSETGNLNNFLSRLFIISLRPIHLHIEIRASDTGFVDALKSSGQLEHIWIKAMENLGKKFWSSLCGKAGSKNAKPMICPNLNTLIVDYRNATHGKRALSEPELEMLARKVVTTRKAANRPIEILCGIHKEASLFEIAGTLEEAQKRFPFVRDTEPASIGSPGRRFYELFL